MCQTVHSSVIDLSKRLLSELNRHNYVTPTSYLELLGIFSKLIGMKKMELNTARNRTKTGLDKVGNSS
jgi:dynein heavy chain